MGMFGRFIEMTGIDDKSVLLAVDHIVIISPHITQVFEGRYETREEGSDVVMVDNRTVRVKQSYQQIRHIIEGGEVMEKIIQIAVTGVEATQSTQCNYIIVALTADGRLWEMSNTWGWHEIPLPTPTPTVSPEREALESLCAGRTPEQIAEALRLLDNREKVVDWLNVIEGLNVSGELKGSHDEISDAVTAALALLAEKEGTT